MAPLAKTRLQAPQAHSELRRDIRYGGPAHRPLPEQTFGLQDEAATGWLDRMAKAFAVVVRMAIQQQREHEFIQRLQCRFGQQASHAARGDYQLGRLLPGTIEFVRERPQREANWRFRRLAPVDRDRRAPTTAKISGQISVAFRGRTKAASSVLNPRSSGDLPGRPPLLRRSRSASNRDWGSLLPRPEQVSNTSI